MVTRGGKAFPSLHTQKAGFCSVTQDLVGFWEVLWESDLVTYQEMCVFKELCDGRVCCSDG